MGVSFEVKGRRGPRKVHPACPFCERMFMVTPRRVSQMGGATRATAQYRDHLLACVQATFGLSDDDEIHPNTVVLMLDAMGQYAVAVERET